MPIDEAEETICLLGRGVVVMPSEGVFPPAVIEKVADKVTLSASKSTSTDPLSVPSKTTERSSPFKKKKVSLCQIAIEIGICDSIERFLRFTMDKKRKLRAHLRFSWLGFAMTSSLNLSRQQCYIPRQW
jgi:hypothetical protein